MDTTTGPRWVGSPAVPRGAKFHRHWVLTVSPYTVSEDECISMLRRMSKEDPGILRKPELGHAGGFATAQHCIADDAVRCAGRDGESAGVWKISSCPRLLLFSESFKLAVKCFLLFSTKQGDNTTGWPQLRRQPPLPPMSSIRVFPPWLTDRSPNICSTGLTRPPMVTLPHPPFKGVDLPENSPRGRILDDIYKRSCAFGFKTSAERVSRDTAGSRRRTGGRLLVVLKGKKTSCSKLKPCASSRISSEKSTSIPAREREASNHLIHV